MSASAAAQPATRLGLGQQDALGRIPMPGLFTARFDPDTIRAPPELEP
jgi:hypothetical protein